MLTRYKNKLFDMVDQHAIDQRHFYPEDSADERAFTLHVRGSQLKFVVWDAPDDYDRFAYQHSLEKPGFPLSVRVPLLGFGAFNNVVNGFNGWIRSSVAPHLKDPRADLWAAMLEAMSTAEEGSTSRQHAGVAHGNTPFTPNELARIPLSTAKLFVDVTEKLELTTAEQRLVEAILAPMNELAKQLKRYTWKTWLLGAIGEVVLGLALGSGEARVVFRAVQEAFSWLIDPPLLP